MGLSGASGARMFGMGQKGAEVVGGLTLGMTGGTANSYAAYQDAERHGASPEEALKAGEYAFLVGTTNAIPTLWWLQRLQRSEAVRGMLAKAASEATQAALQGGGEQFANNVIAQNIYDQNRDLFEGLLEQAETEAGVALIMSTLVSTVANARAGRIGRNVFSSKAFELDKTKLTIGPNPYRDPATDELMIFARRKPPADPQQAAAFERMRGILNDQATADRTYDSLPESQGGKVIGTDIARELLPEYATREGKMQFTQVTNDLAYSYARDRLWREITNPKGRKHLTLMAGGPGAGKSRAIRDALAGDADLVLDSTLSNTDSAVQTIELARSHGWEISIYYVQRSYDDVVKGFFIRTNESGRWLPIKDLPRAHMGAQESILKLGRIYEGSTVDFTYYLNGDIAFDASRIVPGGDLHYYESHEQQGLGREVEGASSRIRTKAALERRNREEFRRVVEAGAAERRILELLAAGDEELRGYVDKYYPADGNRQHIGQDGENTLFARAADGSFEGDGSGVRPHFQAKPGTSGHDDRNSSGQADALAEFNAARKGFEALGVRFTPLEPDAGVVAEVRYGPRGDLVLALAPDHFVSQESRSQSKGLPKGGVSRLTLGEELLHTAHLVSVRNEWIDAGRPGTFDQYFKAANHVVFADIRSAMESASPDERIRLQGALHAAYQLYYRDLGSEGNLSPDRILAHVEESNRSVEFVAEFIRQIAQVRRQGAVREAFLAEMIDRLATWVRDALKRIHTVLPDAYGGKYGQQVQNQLEKIDAILDELDGKPPAALDSLSRDDHQ